MSRQREENVLCRARLKWDVEEKEKKNNVIYSSEFFETLLFSHILRHWNETRIDFAYLNLLRRKEKKTGKNKKRKIFTFIYMKNKYDSVSILTFSLHNLLSNDIEMGLLIIERNEKIHTLIVET